MEDISEEANKKMLENLTTVNEKYKQEVYELKLRLRNAEAMEREAVQQVELVQAELSKEKARESHLSAQHTKDTALLNRQWTEKLEVMEQKFMEEKSVYEQTIVKLKENISELQNISAMDSTETVMELQKIKSKNEEMVELLHTFEEKLAKEKHHSLGLESIAQNLSSELEVAKSNLEQKKDELASAQEMIDNFQAEALQLKLDVERLKAADASHLKRGNSLFAEVEDRRKLLQGHVDACRVKIRKLKAALKNKDSEISKLRADQSHLSFQFKSLEKECKLMDTQWHSSYTQRIQELERTVRDLRGARGGANQPLVLGDDSYKWVQHLLENKQEEVKRLESALEEKSMECLMGADCLHQTRRSLQATKAELLTAKATITNLKMALLTTNPGLDIDDEVQDASETSVRQVTVAPRSGNKENVPSADVCKASFTPHDLEGKTHIAPCASEVDSASKQKLNDVTAGIVNAVINADEIIFPVI